jgi:hypothetical protein
MGIASAAWMRLSDGAALWRAGVTLSGRSSARSPSPGLQEQLVRITTCGG